MAAQVMQAPVVILIKPQLPENIGTAARAMYNGGLTHMRLVAPKGGWPNPNAIKPAAGAHVILDNVTVYETTDEAIKDLHIVYAMTARSRHMTQFVYTPPKAIEKLREFTHQGHQVGIMFGPERSGLDNDDLSKVDGIIQVPLNPEYTSLNLAQAVLVMAYEWFQALEERVPEYLHKDESPLADKQEVLEMFEHLERELDKSGFLRVSPKRPIMVRNIRKMFLRTPLTSQEVRTLRGIIASLADPYYTRNREINKKDAKKRQRGE